MYNILMAKNKPLKILFVSTELSPYATVGGLGRVMFFLPRTLMSLGHEVRVLIPKYGKIDLSSFPMETIYEGLEVPTGNDATPYLICNIKTNRLAGSPRAYFLENMEYYEKRANEYGYIDDPVRWGLLQRGVLTWLKENSQSLKRNPDSQAFFPDIIHCNDWQTGLIPNYLKTVYQGDPDLSSLSIVYTIHNLNFQANFDPRFVGELDKDDGRSEIPDIFSDRFTKLNSMRRAIIYSDLINTVSDKYSKEILTPEYGCGLDQLLQEVRTKLYGIINGIDYDDFNPKTDKIVKYNYDTRSIEKRILNKKELQSEFNLPVNPEIPLFGISYRLDEQKGLDLLEKVMEYVLKEYRVQLVVNGDGEPRFKTYFKTLYEMFPEQVGLNLNANFTLPRHIFSGADFILLPSKFEPCGMVQMEAMRYGCVPIARSVGGLADSVSDGLTGFTFKGYNSFALFGTMIRAIEFYKDQKKWLEIVKNCMNADFSWTNSAKKYENLYYRVLDLTKQRKIAKTHNI